MRAYNLSDIPTFTEAQWAEAQRIAGRVEPRTVAMQLFGECSRFAAKLFATRFDGMAVVMIFDAEDPDELGCPSMLDMWQCEELEAMAS